MFTKFGEEPVKISEQSCQTITEWGRCSQRAGSEGWCTYHLNANNIPSFHHDRSYHRKIVEGLLESSHDVLTETEIEALFRGRARNDGRRTDLYTVL